MCMVQIHTEGFTKMEYKIQFRHHQGPDTSLYSLDDALIEPNIFIM